MLVMLQFDYMNREGVFSKVLLGRVDRVPETRSNAHEKCTRFVVKTISLI